MICHQEMRWIVQGQGQRAEGGQRRKDIHSIVPSVRYQRAASDSSSDAELDSRHHTPNQNRQKNHTRQHEDGRQHIPQELESRGHVGSGPGSLPNRDIQCGKKATRSNTHGSDSSAQSQAFAIARYHTRPEIVEKGLNKFQYRPGSRRAKPFWRMTTEPG